MSGMDIVAVLLAVISFAILLALVTGIERIWAPLISSGWSSRPSWACTSSTRCCGARGS